MLKKAQKILKQHKNELVKKFLKGKAPDFMNQHTRILDQYFCDSFEKSHVGPQMGISRNPYAIVALGGYGRKEQCIYSDIDLLILFKKKVADSTEELVREIIYPLWDLGLEVGHATRSLNDCINLAAEDIEVLTSLLDARFICGMSNLYTELMEKLRDKLISPRSKRIIANLVERNQQRHEHFGDSTYLLEPNLKEGMGGLRDYHSMLWIARIKSNLKHPRDLEYDGYLSYQEFEALKKALSFIWKVRNHLHHLTDRKCDQLHFEHQIKLADILKFETAYGQQPVERFLGQLHGQMEFIKQHYFMLLLELGLTYGTELKPGKKFFTKKTRVSGLEVSRDMLNFSSPEDVVQTPTLLLKIFEESARLKIPLSAEAKRIVKEFLYLADENFSSSAAAVKTFESILLTSSPTFNALNEMLNTGLLEQFIPEFATITNRIQYDEYHLYPVDRHSLHTVQTLKSFGTSEGRRSDQICGDLYKELSNRKLLLWAGLLHDIGKGDPVKDHSESGAETVHRILERIGYKPQQIETVSFLVRHHLFLIKTATRRDINAEETAIYCARRIKSIQRLKMLYMLTVADSMSTGPKAWNNWTSVLLRDLFLKIHNILENGELATEEAVTAAENVKNEILASIQPPRQKTEVEALLDAMSPRYLLYTPARDIRNHIDLYEKLSGRLFTWNIKKSAGTATRTVTICARNCPGLFSKIAGVFTLNNLNILEAQVYTWKNDIALDIFTVTPPPDQIFEEERWERTGRNLKDALLQNIDVSALVRDKTPIYSASKPDSMHNNTGRVVIDNQSSSFFTIIEVFAYDYPGLLFSITDALYKSSVDVWIAKIATNADQIVDVFYVRDYDGQKIDDPDQVAALKNAINLILPFPKTKVA